MTADEPQGAVRTQIGAMLDTLDLEFLGLTLDSEHRESYAALFPQDKAKLSLANWDALEQKFPTAFGGMFTFWVRKK